MHRQPEPLPRGHLGEGSRVFIREQNSIQTDGDFSATGHRVAGVDCEVHHDLLDLRRVSHDDMLSDIDLGVNVNLFGDDPLEHPHRLFDDELEAQRPAFADRGPAEVEDLTDEPRASLPLLRNALSLLDHRGRNIVAGLDELCKTGNRLQHIVEVVSDARRELAHRGQARLLLEVLPRLQLTGQLTDHDDVSPGPGLILRSDRRSRDRKCADPVTSQSATGEGPRSVSRGFRTPADPRADRPRH